MAEPGKETAATPPPLPQETVLQAPAAVAEPSLEIVTPSSALQGTGTAAGGAAALDSAQPKAESAHRPPPPQKTTAAVGDPEQTTTDADGQPPAATMPQKVATLPPPAETTVQESAAPAAPTPPTQRQEGGDPKLASSVHEEKKDARRRWRCLRAAVCLLFLRPKSRGTKPPAPPGDKQPVSRLEEKKKPTPGEMPPPQKDSGSAVRVPSKPDAGKGEGEMKPSAQDDKKPASGQEEQKPAAAKKPSRMHSAGAAREEKDEGEGSKGRRDEAGAQAGKTTPQLQLVEGEHPSLKKFRMVCRLVQCLMSLYNKHRRSQENKPEEKAPGLDGEEADSEAKSGKPASAKEEKTTQHRNWKREEMRLEHILEEAFTRLLATEYNKELNGVRQKCLLTFSVFELASEVKKQAMIYWWVAEFNLRHRSDPPAPAARAVTGGGGRSDSPAAPQGKGADADSSRDDDAEGIFFMLSEHGFLVPMKNWCSKVIHGCHVNPLVHWMLKRQARGERFAELDGKGSPKDLQLNSSILCLTAGNRRVMQKMRMNDEPQPQAKKKDESQSQAGKKRKETSLQGKGDHVQDQQQQPTTKDEAQVGSKSMAAADKAPSQKDEDPTQAKDQLTKPSSKPADNLDEIPPELFEGKRVILNVNAHVYPISRSAFLHLAECLVVLQLGRWNNLDDKTYMEVDGLDTRNAIGLLKNLRYLGLRGLSRLTGLPKGIESLKKLVILDMRGCQNLVKVAASVVAQLKQLTHLDLTECYMLEHIGRGITSLTELQVFKGFVFASGTQGSKACRIQDLKRLKKLQKLTVSITTDANVGKGEMAELKNLNSLRKLTITWSEIPSILEGDTDKVKNKRKDLVERWTSFQLPKDLMKLDIRCYPKEVLQLERHTKLEKLYLRGGDMERFFTNKSNTIKTLRLRYLQNFKMGWDEICSELENIESVEIKVNKDDKQVTSINSVDKKSDFKIPDFTLDGHGVWTKDQKEEDNKQKSDAPGQNKASGPSEPTEKDDKQKSDAPNKDAMGQNKDELSSGPSEPTEEDNKQKSDATNKDAMGQNKAIGPSEPTEDDNKQKPDAPNKDVMGQNKASGPSEPTEEDNKQKSDAPNKDAMGQNKAIGPSEPTEEDNKQKSDAPNKYAMGQNKEPTEEDNKQKLDAPNKDAMGQNKASGPSEPTEEDNKQKSDAPNKDAMGQNKAIGPSEPTEEDNKQKSNAPNKDAMGHNKASGPSEPTEEDNKQKSDAPNKDAMGQNKASGPSEPTMDSSTKVASAITSGNNKDGDKTTTKEQQPKKNE